MTTPDPAESLTDRITTAAAEPAAAASDGQSATSRSIDELIKADRHTAAQRAARAPRFGLGLSRILPGSGLGGGQ
jgi:hypothetical protein